jgi:hypothetical protein
MNLPVFDKAPNSLRYLSRTLRHALRAERQSLKGVSGREEETSFCRNQPEVTKLV